MPYISGLRRDQLALNGDNPNTPGDLNYMLTVLCEMYLGRRGTCYQTINDVVGALECAKLEFYRRIAVPYETRKIEENGDVYDTTD